MALEREDECFFEGEKGKVVGGKEAKNWRVLCQPRCLRAMNKARKCWSFLYHLCLSLGRRAGPQAPSL